MTTFSPERSPTQKPCRSVAPGQAGFAYRDHAETHERLCTSTSGIPLVDSCPQRPPRGLTPNNALNELQADTCVGGQDKRLARCSRPGLLIRLTNSSPLVRVRSLPRIRITFGVSLLTWHVGGLSRLRRRRQRGPSVSRSPVSHRSTVSRTYRRTH